MDTFILVFGAFALALVVFAGACAIFAAFTLQQAAAFTRQFQAEVDELNHAQAPKDPKNDVHGDPFDPGPVPLDYPQEPISAPLRRSYAFGNGLLAPETPKRARFGYGSSRSNCAFCQKVRNFLNLG